MTRRELLPLAFVAPLLGQTSKPNIVLILADDLGIGDLGCYGQTKIPTPNIDALAAQGVRFTSAYSGSTVCAPSRCCLMTGMHTGHSRIRGNGKNETVLRKEDVVIPELLRPAGYRTGIFGKWALGGLGHPGYPTKKGFEEWFGYFSQTQAHNYYPEVLLHNDTWYELPGNTGTRKKDYAPNVIHDYAMRWLDKQSAAAPFFLYYNSTIPHANNELGRDTGNGQEVPEDAPYSSQPWPQVEKNFAAMVSILDRKVGDIVARLRQKGLLDNTLILFTSDNGSHKEGGHDPDFFDSNSKYRGIKRDLYEGGIRVPALATWPGKIPPGSVSDVPWAFWDLLPTFCEAAGVPAPKGIDGLSALDIFTSKTSLARHDYFYWEFHEQGFAQAVRRGDWKLVKLKNGKEELYDLATDPSEEKNLVQVQPAVRAELAQILKSARTDSMDWPVQALK